MRCPMCSNTMHMRETTVTRTVNGKPAKFTSVPALVCENDICGQVALYPDAANKVEDVAVKARSAKIDIAPAFDYKQADKFLEELP